jgi:dimethylargininase
VAPGLVLLNPAWVARGTFVAHDAIDVDPGEPFAANVLRVGTAIVCASAYERTRARLESAGLELRPIEVSELAKAEAGVTCCSLIFNA